MPAEARPVGAGSSKIGPNRGLPPPSLAWLASALAKARGMTASSTPARETDVVGAHHLEQAGLVDDRHLRAAGEEHLAAAPPESVADEVGAERPEVLGARHGEERQPATAPGPARLAGALEGGGDHPGGGDRRHGVDRHARRRLPAQLPRQGGDGPLGAAVAAGVGGPPPRAGGDAEDAAVPGRGHERQRGLEHVEVAPEVHREHRQPVLLGALGEVGLPGDAGDVDHGIEPAVLVDQLPEQGAHAPRRR